MKKYSGKPTQENKDQLHDFEKGFKEASKDNIKVIPYFKRAIKSFECKKF